MMEIPAEMLDIKCGVDFIKPELNLPRGTKGHDPI